LATHGLQSRRKTAAARRNLRKARQQKRLKRLRANIQALMPWFKTALEDLALVERKVAQSRAELLALAPAIRQDPELTEVLDWLKSRWAQEAGGDLHLTDSRLVNNAAQARREVGARYGTET
jgi:hypothetical protein